MTYKSDFQEQVVACTTTIDGQMVPHNTNIYTLMRNWHWWTFGYLFFAERMVTCSTFIDKQARAYNNNYLYFEKHTDIDEHMVAYNTDISDNNSMLIWHLRENGTLEHELSWTNFSMQMVAYKTDIDEQTVAYINIALTSLHHEYW